MAAPRSVSVLMPTWQGEEFLERVLAALATQELDRPWDLSVVDSGSSDRTLEILEAYRERLAVPLSVRGIHQVEFDHGDTRNLLAALSEGQLLVFLTQDAIPSSKDWLANLTANFDDPRVGAAYCRNLARPDAELLTRVFSEKDPGYQPGRREVRIEDRAAYEQLDAHQKRLLYNFNDVASAVRRELWERHPFPRTSFGEDVLMARALLEGGHTVVYDDRATVEHSHDYGPVEMSKRAEIDGRFNVEWLERVCVGSKKDAETLVGRQLEADRRALEEAGVAGAELERQLAAARDLRRAAFLGLWRGGRSEQRFPSTRMLEKKYLKLLYVVHGFPPDTWAGTEVYTLNLALEMQRLGHEVCVLTRAPAEGDEPEFSLRQDEYEGLRVWRMTHRLGHDSLRQSYDQPRAEEAFLEVLGRERPDLVHFQHLIHLSGGLVRRARALALPTVLTCHDYWALCARVQMIRPDGERCSENKRSGCYLCVTEQGLHHVERLAKLEKRAPALFAALAAGRRHAKFLRGTAWLDLRARHDFLLGAYAAADLRISPSRFLRDKLLESGAFDPQRFLYSDNGMRTDGLRSVPKRSSADGRLRLGFIGSLVWYKGVDVLVRAMNELKDLPVELSVHGDFRPDEDDHHRELRDLAGANVSFRGRFSNEKLAEVYAELDVLVVPSVWFENSPITIHEAHLYSTPVVASGIGGMAEYVRDGVDGLHFAVGDPRDLARVLRRLVDEPGLALELSRDFPRIKTIAENARETEFRYRSLCCLEREPGPAPELELAGPRTAAREGPVEVQGADLLLLRPGAAVEYDLTLAGAGPREITVELLALGPETTLELGGRALVDGVEVAALGPFRSRGSDETRPVRFEVELPPRPSRLRLETRLADGGQAHLRVARVRVGEPAARALAPGASH